MTTVLPAPGSAHIVPRPPLATTPDPHTTSQRKRPPTLADRRAPVDHCFLPIQALLCTELWLVVRWPPLTLLTFPPSSLSVPARADLILRENQGALMGGRMELAGLHARLCCAQRPPALESTVGSDATLPGGPPPHPPPGEQAAVRGRGMDSSGAGGRARHPGASGGAHRDCWSQKSGGSRTPRSPLAAQPWEDHGRGCPLAQAVTLQKQRKETGQRATVTAGHPAPGSLVPERAGCRGATGGGAQGGRADTGGSETGAAAVWGRPHPAGEQWWCGPAWGALQRRQEGPTGTRAARQGPGGLSGAASRAFRWDLPKACGSGYKPRPAPPHLRLTKLPSECS